MTLTQLWQSISKKEWLIIIGVGLILALIILGVPFFGWLKTPRESFWTGILSLAPGDFSVYESYLWQVKDGHWLFSNLFGPEPIKLFSTWWLFVGLIGKILNLQPNITLHLVKIIPLPFLLITTYLLLAYFFSKKWRIITFIFLCFSSGLGALAAPLFQTYNLLNSKIDFWQWPLDLWVPESNFFLSLYYSSHFSLVLTLFLFTLLCFFLALETQKIRYFLFAGLSNLLLFSFHPFHLPTLMAITLTCFFLSWFRHFWRWPSTILLKLSGYLLLSLIPILYYLYSLLTNPYLWQRASQNICLSPHFIFTFLGYGFSLLLAFGGMVLVLKKFRKRKEIFLVIWAIAQGICLYLPFNFQRRLNTGWQACLVILSFIFLSWLVQRYSKLQKVYLLAFLPLIVLFFFTSNIVNLARDVITHQDNNPIYYFPSSYNELFTFIRKNITQENVILAPWPAANFLPGYTGRRVYFGHGVETIYFRTKMEAAEKIFQAAETEADIYQFCLSQGITHLLLTPNEPLFHATLQPYFQKIFANRDFNLYQIVPRKNFD